MKVRFLLLLSAIASCGGCCARGNLNIFNFDFRKADAPAAAPAEPKPDAPAASPSVRP